MIERMEQHMIRCGIDKKVYDFLQPEVGKKLSQRMLSGKTRFLVLPKQEILLYIDHDVRKVFFHPALTSTFPQDAKSIEAILKTNGFFVEKLA